MVFISLSDTDTYHSHFGCQGAWLPMPHGYAGGHHICAKCEEKDRKKYEAKQAREQRIYEAQQARNKPKPSPYIQKAHDFIQNLDTIIDVNKLDTDESEEIRLDVVDKIEEEIQHVEDEKNREKYRLYLQLAWNEQHPETPIAVWCDLDPDELEKLKLDNKEKKDLWNFWMHEETPVIVTTGGFHGHAYKKTTGEDVTDEIHHADFMVRYYEYYMKYPDPDNPIIYDFEDEFMWISMRYVDAFNEWLAQKRLQSTHYKYHKGIDTTDKKHEKLRLKVYREFEEETQYVNKTHEDYEAAKAAQENAQQSNYQKYNELLQEAKKYRDYIINKYQLDTTEKIPVEEINTIMFHIRDNYLILDEFNRPINDDEPEYDPVSDKTIPCTVLKFAEF